MATVSKNILWSSVTSILQVYTGSIVFIVLAKLMSLEDFGVLSFGFSLSTILCICADFGLSLMIIKDYPKNKYNHKIYVFNGLFFKVLVSILVCAIASLYLYLLYEGNWLVVGIIYLAFAIVTSFTLYFQALLKVQNRFEKFTETTIIYALGISVVVIMYWIKGTDLITLAFYLLLCKIAQLIWCMFICRNDLAIWSVNREIQNYFFKNSWSFGLHTILGIFYFMIDTQIISIYLGSEQVALYQSVFRIILIFLMISELLSNVLLPYLSFKYANNEDISVIVSKILLLLLIIGCSLFLFLTTFKSLIMQILYSTKYLSAVPLLIPLSIIIVLRTISSLLGNILTISNKQVYRVITVFVTLTISVVFNFSFIPMYGIIAAAWISVLVHFVLFLLYYYYSRKVLSNISLFSKDLLFVIMMTLGIYFSLHYFSSSELYFKLIGVLIWLFSVIIVMKYDGNFIFLKKILKDRGVG